LRGSVIGALAGIALEQTRQSPVGWTYFELLEPLYVVEQHGDAAGRALDLEGFYFLNGQVNRLFLLTVRTGEGKFLVHFDFILRTL